MQRLKACAALALALVYLCACDIAPRPRSADRPSPLTNVTSSTSGSESADPEALPRFGAIAVNDRTGTSVTMRTTNVAGEHVSQSTPTDTGGETATVTGNRLDVNISGTAALSASLPAGTNNIGDVDVLTLPPLVAGTANIGDVDVLTLPALPTGTNNIGDVDVLSLVPGTGPTNLGKAEDAAHVTGDTGVPMLARVTSTEAGSSATDGDYATLSVDPWGALRVYDDTSLAEDTAFANGAFGQMSFARVDDSSGSSATAGDAATLNVTSTGELRVAGTFVGGATEATLADIEGDIDTVVARTPVLGQAAMAASSPVVIASNQSAIPVTGTTAEDAAAADGALGTLALARVDDSGASSSTGGDAATLNVTSGGNLRVALAAGGTIGLAAGSNNVGTVNIGTFPALPPGTNNIGDVDVLALPPLVAGTANIGDVDVLTLPAIPAGTNNIGDVDVLSVVPGTGATALGKAEDAVHSTGDTGVQMLARVDASGGSTATAGDYGTLNLTTTGELRVSAGTTAINGYVEQVLFNAVASNSDQTSAVIDARGYAYVVVDLQFTDVTMAGNLLVYGDTASGTVVSRALRVGLAGGSTHVAQFGDACSSGVDGNVALPLAHTSGGGGNRSCWVKIFHPPPYIAVVYDQTSGGGAAGLTGRIYGRAN